VGSLEGRLPVWRSGGSELVLLAFADAGHSWNDEDGLTPPRTPASLGLGLRARFARTFYSELTWARALNDRAQPAEKDLQDHGVQFRFAFDY
jgi:hemolysin activation/secretion protein